MNNIYEMRYAVLNAHANIAPARVHVVDMSDGRTTEVFMTNSLWCETHVHMTEHNRYMIRTS